jgi:hypothetical protein
LACSIPAFAFTSTQTQGQLNTEVGQRLNGTDGFAKQSMEEVAKAANDAKVPVDPISLAFSFYEKSYDKVLVAMANAGFDTAAVINALVKHGADRTALIATAVDKIAGTNPATLTAATAAGSTTAPPALNAAAIGFTGNSVSRSSTVGGSGTSITTSVSPS